MSGPIDSPSDPRQMVHKPSVQRLDPTFNAPNKPLSHSTKYKAAPRGGPIMVLIPIRKRRRWL